MKKRIKFLVIGLIFAFVTIISIFIYLFVININRSPKIGTWSNNIINKNLVVMELKKETLTNNYLSVTITNNTKETYNYGNAYTIEYYKNGFWHYLKPINKISFLLNSIALNPNSTNTINFDWKDYYGNLPNGRYRIVKLLVSNNKDDNFYSAVEFTIE